MLSGQLQIPPAARSRTVTDPLVSAGAGAFPLPSKGPPVWRTCSGLLADGGRGRLSSAEHVPVASGGPAMTHQRTTSRLAFIARPGALRVARAMAAVRFGTGAIGVLAPGRLAWRLFL